MSATRRYYSVGYDRPSDTWRILGWSRTPQAALDRPGTRYRAYASSRQQAAALMKRDYGIALQWKKFDVSARPPARQPDPARGEYLYEMKEIRVCRGCNPASEVTAHTCGLSGLQDQLRIGG